MPHVPRLDPYSPHAPRGRPPLLGAAAFVDAHTRELRSGDREAVAARHDRAG